MATRVVFIPGFMGSALYMVPRGQPHDPNRARKIWLDVWGLSNGEHYFDLMYPDRPEIDIFPSGLLTEGYGDTIAYLANPANKPDGWDFLTWGYDWRMDVGTLGSQLLDLVEGLWSEGDKTYLVAHSQGALICRSLWTQLQLTNKAHLVSRIITIGGILHGCYSPILAWTERENSGNLFSMIGGFTRSVLDPFRFRFNYIEIYRTIARLMVSWPSMYHMLPDYFKTDDPGDTNRGLAYDSVALSYCLEPPDRDRLSDAINLWWRRFHEGAYTYPPWIWFHIVSTGRQTAWRLDPPVFDPPLAFRYPTYNIGALRQRQGNSPTVLYSGLGDDRATVAQQRFANCPILSVYGAHAELQNHPDVLGAIYPTLLNPPEEGDTPADTEGSGLDWPERPGYESLDTFGIVDPELLEKP